MEDLIAWLLEQVADDERAALAAFGNGSPRWSTESYDHGTEVKVRDGDGFCVIHSDGELNLVEAEHIARWDPARVLALVAAMREILSDFSWEAQEVIAIQLLAEALYGDHDGYRPEWRSPYSRLAPFVQLNQPSTHQELT